MKIETCLPTPEMVRHLNLEVIVSSNGHVVSSRTRNKTVMDILIHNGFLESHHAEYAFIYLALRMAWLAPVSFKRSSLMDEVKCWFDMTIVSPANIYEDVYRIVKAPRTKIIAWATTTPEQKMRAEECDICRQSFEVMVDAVDDAREKFKKSIA